MLSVLPVRDIPLIKAGDDLGDLIGTALLRADISPQDGDVLVVAQKIVSKSEGRMVRLDSVTPSDRAIELAQEVDKDPRVVELILGESTDIVRKAPGVLIVRHRLGIVSANAGIDQSNIDHSEGEMALLLPRDPDRSAANLRAALQQRFAKTLAVVIGDSVNRPWRLGSVAIAIGSAGLEVLDDRRGSDDLFGRELMITLINRADALATAAVLMMGEAGERTPVALIRGCEGALGEQTAADAIRPLDEDLFT
jgi:coenzyme F420-0:L-glutamate ligase/coenzyme F420-1:gamma-L-glutamate ligase